MRKTRLGIIGGTSLYEIEGLNIIDEAAPHTPWGDASDTIIIGEINGTRAAFLPRHGRGHVHLPGQINNRANIAALKMLGVEEIIAFSAVGSLKEEIKPMDFVLPDQVIDRTRERVHTFFGDGIVGHIAFADPFCDRVQRIIEPVIRSMGITLHTGETLVCMEGPAFSTRAESRLYRSWNAGVINMSTLPEAKLAREAGICYAVICMSTDYDCWKDDGEHVTVEMVVQNLHKNADNAKNLIRSLIPKMGQKRDCGCSEASKYAVITAPEKRNPETAEKLSVILPECF